MKQFRKLKAFLSLSWKISHSYIFALLCNTIFSGFQVFVNVLLPKYLIDELIGACNINKLIFYAGLIVGSNVLFTLIQKTMKRVLDVKAIYIKNRFNQEMGKKIMNVSYSYLEDPYYLDLKERAIFNINNQGVVQNIILNLTDALKNLFTLVGLIGILLTLSIYIVLILLVCIVITLLIFTSFSKYQVNFFKEIVPTNRKYMVYLETGFRDENQKDIRLYSMTKMLTDKITYYNVEINRWFTSFYRRFGRINSYNSILNDFQVAIVNCYVGLRTITNTFGPKISIGSFTAYVAGALNFSKLSVVFLQNVVVLFQMLAYLDPFVEFMALPDEILDKGKVNFEGNVETIRFNNVSFKYPKSDKLILKNLSFEIKRGEKISIVGLNGAGKTTLVKLICRLFKPTEGNIFINDVNIFDYEYESYMKKIATVFQDYKLFNFSIDENITCNYENSDNEIVLGLLEDVGLKEKIDSLENGISTKFGKQYDENGIEMSGGQSQKVAIARALYKNASLVILDEPTSALDPIAEAEIYEKFNRMVGDKTAIYISHRMSSSVFCDKILIIDNGEVQDFDSHQNLMKKTDSLYYTLFNAQAVNYQV